MNEAMKTALRNLHSCVQDAPIGTHQDAKQVASVIGKACDILIDDVRSMGLKADNCDLIFAVEAALYDYVKRSNPGATIFPAAEGFAESLNSEDRERVIASAERDRDFLAGIHPHSLA